MSKSETLLAEILFYALRYDDKPHQLFSALLRAAEASDMSAEDKLELSRVLTDAHQTARTPDTIRKLLQYEDKWRALVNSPRIRFIGGANIGKSDMLLGLEFYAEYPSKEDNSYALKMLETFVNIRMEEL